ncbi:MAG TPA: TolC family protein, partial [Longimicrobiales bacterium]
QVRTAYYQALLAKQMEQIARAALEQAEAFLAEERLRRQAGQSSDLDVMRAEVAAENLRPGLVQAQKSAELAELNLKRLLDLPLKQPLVLTTELVPPDPSVVASPPVASAERLLSRRAAVEAARRQVSMREEQVRIAKSAFLPTVALQMNYGRLLYPNRMFDFAGVEPRTDWSATISLQLPIFQGFKRTADIDLAEAELESAKLRLAQLEEQVELQYQQALGDRERAGAEITARQRTVEQAERVYDLTRMRYERGLATQLEVSEARLALLQARTNLAQALADFYIADAAVIRALGGRAVVERNRN